MGAVEEGYAGDDRMARVSVDDDMGFLACAKENLDPADESEGRSDAEGCFDISDPRFYDECLGKKGGRR